MKFRSSGGKFFRKLILIPGAILLLLFCYFFFDEDGGAYMLLFNQDSASDKEEVSTISDLTSMGAPPSTEEEPEADIASTTGTTEGVTNGTGLNLLLINSIEANGYVKEYLTLLKNNQEGLYSNYKYNIPMKLVLGLATNETNLIAETIPKTYIPIEETTIGGKKAYNFIWSKDYCGVTASNMTLSRYDRGIYNQINSFYGYGPNTFFTPAKKSADYNTINSGSSTIYTGAFQLNEGETTPVATVNGATNSGRTKRDFAFFIDDLNHLNYYYNYRVIDTFGAANIDGLTDEQIGALYSIAHNRGSCYHAAFGWSYGADSADGSLANNYDMDKIGKAGYARLVCTIVDDISKRLETLKGLSFSGIMSSSHHRWLGIFCALDQDQGWWLSPLAYETMSNSSYATSRYAKEAYARLNGLQLSEVPNDYYVKYKDRVATLDSAMQKVNGVKLTQQEFLDIYGCPGDYDTYTQEENGSLGNALFGKYGQYPVGYLFKVTKERSQAYVHKYSDGSDPFLVQCYDVINVGHVFSCSFLGEHLYARLLKYAGVDVDITNPDTYRAKLADLQVQYGTGTSSGVNTDMLKIINSLGYSFPDTLPSVRSDVINEAFTWMGTPYGYDDQGDDSYLYKGFAGASGVKGKGVDCTGFVYRTYLNLGYGINYVSTAEWITNYFGGNVDDKWTWVPYTELQPGDVLVSRKSNGNGGHAVIFLSRKDDIKDPSNYLVIDSATGGVKIRNGISDERTIYTENKMPEYFVNGVWYTFRVNASTFIPR